MPGGPQLDPSLAPTHDELLLGSMLRAQPGIERLPAEHRTPRAAIEDAMRPALRRGRCFVLFSGGQDSSVLLAIAAHVARTEGLAPPVPISHRYAADAGADEREWQELVVRHLGLREWVISDLTDEHDLLGPGGRSVLERHGVQLPAYWWITRLPVAAGGTPITAPPANATTATLITGQGGDEAFAASPWPRVARLLRGDPRALRHPRALRSEVRTVRWRRRHVAEFLLDDMPWVRAQHRAGLAERRAVEMVAFRRRYARYLDGLWASRMTQAVLDRVSVAARESGADLINPMQTPQVLAALAGRYGLTHPASRAAAYREIAGELLPEALLSRTSKGVASSSFVGPHTREWLESWDGEGPDAEFVDYDVVRRLMLALAAGRDGGEARVTALTARAWLAQRE